MATKTLWSRNAQGWCCTTLKVGAKAIFVALMREGADTWKWVGFANGHPLGRFDGLMNAKRLAPRRVREAGL